MNSNEKPPSKVQIGGSHYAQFAIQPSEFIHRNKLGWCESNAVKYICRHPHKGGRQDIEKAIHYLELLLEWQYGEEVPANPARAPIAVLPERHGSSWPYHPGIKVDPYEGE